MKVIFFGATGMVGQGVLRECLLDERVERVLVIGRAPVPSSAAKLEQVVVPDLFDLSSVAGRMAGFDTVFYCLGVSSVGIKEPEHTRVTKDLTLSIADVVRERCGPDVRFICLGWLDRLERGSMRSHSVSRVRPTQSRSWSMCSADSRAEWLRGLPAIGRPQPLTV
jgi:putative NADH-flavin reductase